MARRPSPPGPGWTALVTGASTGIGRAFAHHLAARGVDLVLVARDRGRLDELAAELRERHGRHVDVLPADLTRPDELGRVERRLREPDDRPVDLLVNNAGTTHSGPFADLDVDAEERIVRLDVVAVLRLAHAALGGMRQRGRGALVNVSSLSGYAPVGGIATYSASKAFVTAFSQALGQEHRRDGITVLALCPGLTHTEFHGRTGWRPSRAPDAVWMTADQVVAAALRALDRGRSVCVPGWHNKVAAFGARVAPQPLVARVATTVGRAP